ncbi:putative Hydroxyquinol 1,2-dioxygenase [Streptomyces afghaniensis 772]|uniref:Putative Hydroxyquinol 1,2-dioxygenase n=1 Tax=Streptomyces afghaniensis 772 TaxID=1283301 RepID=S4MK10_9ACTN|nr:dioxygenase [Streptomyces afghaniensis]EPJ39868.1 putative Hydroxyquinol 1,2-dioxygenase [Streptomyces afghaniensis 772]
MGHGALARLAELMTALVRHLHAYAREVGLTEEEWAAAVEWLTATGRISDDKRLEFILASDVLGLSTLVVQMSHHFSADATPATVLGPFHIDGSPTAGFGADMSGGIPGTPLFITGRVLDLDGTPLPDVVLDVWQADADGAYEAQLPDIDEARLRALYRTRADGTYCAQGRSVAPAEATAASRLPRPARSGTGRSATTLARVLPEFEAAPAEILYNGAQWARAWPGAG